MFSCKFPMARPPAILPPTSSCRAATIPGTNFLEGHVFQTARGPVYIRVCYSSSSLRLSCAARPREGSRVRTVWRYRNAPRREEVLSIVLDEVCAQEGACKMRQRGSGCLTDDDFRTTCVVILSLSAPRAQDKRIRVDNMVTPAA
jgi:hypothetical protein